MNVVDMVNLYSGGFLSKNFILILFYFVVTILYYLLEVGGITYIISNLNSLNRKIMIISFLLLSLLVSINYLKGISENKISSGINSYSRQKIFNGIIERYKESYTDIKIGNVISRVFATTLEFRFGFILFMKVIFPTLLVLLICSIIIFKINKNIGFILLVCIGITIILSKIGYNKIAQKKINQEITFYQNFDNLVNKYNNLMNSYINNKTKYEKENTTMKEKKYGNKLLDADNEMIKNTVFLRINLCLFMFFIFCYIYLNKIKIDKKGIIGIVLVYFFNNYLIYSIETSNFFSHLGICFGSFKFFDEMLLKQQKAKIKHINNGTIKIENLSFSYNKGHKIFNNMTLNIKNGEKTAIMGRSGSGKSTFAKLILKLYPYQGKISVGGVDIQKINTDFLREKINYINQRTVLLDKSVIENMKYGNNMDDKKIIDFLNKYDLKVVFSGLKDNIYEKCSTGGNNLSLGMQKIIILVRGIIKSRKSIIIFFDEPLAGLDQVSRKKVINMILKECKGKTILVITHDKEIIPYMDRVQKLNT
jgi:ABC-type multidrug transport system fused ATPase/permease subunit